MLKKISILIAVLVVISAALFFILPRLEEWGIFTGSSEVQNGRIAATLTGGWSTNSIATGEYDFSSFTSDDGVMELNIYVGENQNHDSASYAKWMSGEMGGDEPKPGPDGLFTFVSMQEGRPCRTLAGVKDGYLVSVSAIGAGDRLKAAAASIVLWGQYKPPTDALF